MIPNAKLTCWTGERCRSPSCCVRTRRARQGSRSVTRWWSAMLLLYSSNLNNGTVRYCTGLVTKEWPVILLLLSSNLNNGTVTVQDWSPGGGRPCCYCKGSIWTMVLLMYRTGHKGEVRHVVAVKPQSEQWYYYCTSQIWTTLSTILYLHTGKTKEQLRWSETSWF